MMIHSLAFNLQNEKSIRLAFFLGVLLFLVFCEVLWPRRKLRQPKPTRWVNNLGITIFDTLLLRLLLPAGAVGIASFTKEYGIGLFNWFEFQENWLIILFSVIFLDFWIYCQHYVYHQVPIFWRMHQVHHSDLDFDVTTGIRFHPLEIIVSIGIKAIPIVVLGLSPLSVLIFEVVLNASSLFEHSNLNIPQKIDWFLRLFIITPDMHRVHHSVLAHETNSNYGFNLSCWDYIFKTYRAQPEQGHQQVQIGLPHLQNNSDVGFLKLLIMPFRKLLTMPR